MHIVTTDTNFFVHLLSAYTIEQNIVTYKFYVNV